MTIVFADPKPYPIPLHRRRRHDYYKGYSCKLQRPVEFESELEYWHWLLQEANPDIIMLCEQYPRVEGVEKGKRFSYTFDLYTRERSGIETCIEVKPRRRLIINEAGELAPQNWHQALNAASEWGVQCRFVTEEDLELHRTLIDNWSSIMPFVQRAMIEDLESVEERILQIISDDISLSLDGLSRRIKSAYPEQVVAAACHLLHQGRLISEDLVNVGFNAEITVSLPNHAA